MAEYPDLGSEARVDALYEVCTAGNALLPLGDYLQDPSVLFADLGSATNVAVGGTGTYAGYTLEITVQNLEFVANSEPSTALDTVTMDSGFRAQATVTNTTERTFPLKMSYFTLVAAYPTSSAACTLSSALPSGDSCLLIQGQDLAPDELPLLGSTTLSLERLPHPRDPVPEAEAIQDALRSPTALAITNNFTYSYDGYDGKCQAALGGSDTNVLVAAPAAAYDTFCA